MGGLGALKPLGGGASFKEDSSPPVQSKPPVPTRQTRLQPRRLGIRFKPPALALEFEDRKHNKVRKKPFKIDCSQGKTARELAADIIKQNHFYFRSQHVNREQVERLVQRVLDHLAARSALEAAKAAKAPRGSARGAAPEPESEEEEEAMCFMPGDDEPDPENYNGLSEQERARKQKEMDRSFKPITKGDQGYVYEKNVEFKPTEKSEWDESGDGEDAEEACDEDYEDELAKYADGDDDDYDIGAESGVRDSYENDYNDSFADAGTYEASTDQAAPSQPASQPAPVKEEEEEEEAAAAPAKSIGFQDEPEASEEDMNDPFEDEDISEDEMSFDIGSDAEDDF